MGAINPVETSSLPAMGLNRKQKKYIITKFKSIRFLGRLSRFFLFSSLFVVAFFIFFTLQSPIQVHLSPFEMLRLSACPSFFEAAEVYSPNPSSDYVSIHQLSTHQPLHIKSKQYQLEYDVNLFNDDLSPRTHLREFHFDATSPFTVSYESSSPVHFGVSHLKVANHQDHRNNIKRDEAETEDRENEKDQKEESQEEKQQDWNHHREKEIGDRHKDREEEYGPHDRKGKHHNKHHNKEWKHHKNHYKKEREHGKKEKYIEPKTSHREENAESMGRVTIRPSGGVYKVFFSLPKNSTNDAKIRVKLDANVRTIAFEDCPFSTSLKEGQKTIFLNKHEKVVHIIAASPHTPSGSVVYVKFVPRASKFLMIFLCLVISAVILKLVRMFLIVKEFRRM